MYILCVGWVLAVVFLSNPGRLFIRERRSEQETRQAYKERKYQALMKKASLLKA